MDIFNDILMEVNIGIEIETCFGILDYNLEDESMAQERYFDTIHKKVSDLKQLVPNHERKLYDIDYIPSNEATEYDRWHLMHDDSVFCHPGINMGGKIYPLEYSRFYHEGLEYQLQSDSGIYFHPIEIVTPKMTYYSGLIALTNMWNKVFMSKEYVYNINNSQGLHINLSHPKLNANRFLDSWIKLEPYIIRNLPDYRLQSIKDWAIPFTYPVNPGSRIAQWNIYERAFSYKYMALGIRTNFKYGRRIEVRIYQSTMDLQEIIDWTSFCVFIAAMSITYPNFDIEQFRSLLPPTLHKFIL